MKTISIMLTELLCTNPGNPMFALRRFERIPSISSSPSSSCALWRPHPRPHLLLLAVSFACNLYFGNEARADSPAANIPSASSPASNRPVPGNPLATSIPASSENPTAATGPGSPPEPPALGSSSQTAPPIKGTASVTGKITDTTRERLIQNARVVLTKVGEEHKRYQTETGADGVFKFENLEPGDYKITISAKDMLSDSDEISLKEDQTKVFDAPLDDVEPVDVLRITGKQTLIHPEQIGSTTNLDHKFVYQYKSGNDLRDLVTSTPGVMNDSYGNIITRGEHNSINYVVDDVVIPEAAGVLQQSQVISPRSVQSMSVDIGGYQASDGGGPLGAVARMKSLPINPKPNFDIGQQIGGPLAGSIFYNTSGALSQRTDSIWHRVRFESSGSFRMTSYGIAPPVKDYVHNGRTDINSFTKIEFTPTPRDTFRLTTSINETTFQIPTSGYSATAGVKDRQSDGQNYIIASYIHKFERWLDEANLHLLNGIYYERFRSSNAFDPGVQFNNGQPEQSIAANAKRFNYIFSAQGNVTKSLGQTHHFKAGFYTELRPVSTFYNATYFNADYLGSIPSASNPNPVPYGAVISPFTGMPGGPQFTGNMGKFSGFRYLQSAFFQDKFTPQKGFWKRLTLDAGLRFDMQRSIYGNTLALAQAIINTPGAQPFALQPYQKQATTDAQVSGRFGAALVLDKKTVFRGSFSNLFMPNPTDIFITPYNVVSGQLTPGIYDGTPRPLHATRGYLIDSSLEHQFGTRSALRINLFYKYLTNFGDSGVVGNLPLYNRLTNSAQDAYGVETRYDLKPKRDGYGFNGFLSNTIQVAYLRGTKTPSGGFYATPQAPFMIFPDHDRRMSTVAGLGYKTRQNIWCLFTAQVLSGLQDERDPTIYGPHPARTPFITDLAFNAGYQTPRNIAKAHRWMPTSFDVRIDNLLNQRVPINLGSPFQGTRFSLPIRVLASCQWQLGPEEAKLSSVHKPQI
ncbi:MAG TPA: carboxypeptidase regulatory-like domain-containing protein [Oculatellaceae cyanobacterium]